jgi:hypothetical protein
MRHPAALPAGCLGSHLLQEQFIMAHQHATESLDTAAVPCCPALGANTACDVLDFHYRLVHGTNVVAGNRNVQVEVLVHARFERCPGPMTLGDLL